MSTEMKPIPRLAKSAATLAQAEFQTTINNLGIQTLEAMGLSTDEGWSVNFTTGFASREVPDKSGAPAELVAATEPPATTEVKENA